MRALIYIVVLLGTLPAHAINLCFWKLSGREYAEGKRILENWRQELLEDQSPLLPVIIPRDVLVRSLSVETLTQEERDFMNMMEARRREWLIDTAKLGKFDRKTATEEQILARDQIVAAIHEKDNAFVCDLGLSQRLKLMTAALNDFNKTERSRGRSYFPNPESHPKYRMAAAINEASRSTYKIRPLTPAELKKRMKEHIVLTYFISILDTNKDVGTFRFEVFKIFPDLKNLFTPETLSKYQKDPSVWNRYISEIDETLMRYFLFEYGKT